MNGDEKDKAEVEENLDEIVFLASEMSTAEQHRIASILQLVGQNKPLVLTNRSC